MQISYLDPIDQLFYLNKEFYSKLNNLSSPIYVVGGQAIAYWVKYYEKELTPTDDDWRTAHSVDIDYMSKIEDVSIVAECWDVPVSFARNHQPPSIALIKLETLDKKVKETNKGLLFLDVDELNAAGDVIGNIVDFIDRPAGFSIKEFESKKLCNVYTANFCFPDEYNLEPSNQLRVLTPIGCLKSRLANLFHTQKSKEIEIKRIRLLRHLILFYFQDCALDLDFRELKTHIDSLYNILMSNDGIKLYQVYDVDLREIFYIIFSFEFLPDIFIDKEAKFMREKLDEKYKRRKKAYKKYLKTKTA